VTLNDAVNHMLLNMLETACFFTILAAVIINSTIWV